MDRNLYTLLLFVVLLPQILVTSSSNIQEQFELWINSCFDADKVHELSFDNCSRTTIVTKHCNGLKFFEMENLPPSWRDFDPCGTKWEGLECVNSKVTFIRLSSMGLKGYLTEDTEQLSELQLLDLSYNKDLTGQLPQSIGNLKKLTSLIVAGCGFSGEIPATIGSLKKLVVLSLNSNKFHGVIPQSIGYLSGLVWLDLTDNNIGGPIPVSNGNTSGLDMLLHLRHMHLGKNKLTGPIPNRLFSGNMKLIHVLLDSNKLSGKIPSSLGLIQTLEVIDLSNNSFEESLFPPWFSNLQSLQTLIMEDSKLQGKIPADLFNIPSLEIVKLKNNNLDGLEIDSSYSKNLKLIDLQRNSIMEFNNNNISQKVQIILVGNTICTESRPQESYCNDSLTQTMSSYVTARNCFSGHCKSPRISSPKCACAYPYTGYLSFVALSSRDVQDSFYKKVETSLEKFFSDYSFPVDSFSLSSTTKSALGYLVIRLEIFPRGRDCFNRTEISDLGYAFVNQTYDPRVFGPLLFIGVSYEYYAGEKVCEKSKHMSSVGLFGAIGGGGSAILLLLLLGGMYAYVRMRRAERKADPSNSLSWASSKHTERVPHLKTAKLFSFKELRKYTQNFSPENEIGCGGYGTVYLGTLPNGELVAVKRAKSESMQGSIEFTTEIELLSRLHHKNLVSLMGFCLDRGEQMLIYEYVPNGNLKDSLSGKSGIRLDWMERLMVALDTAKGIAYLHEFADPPIIHRDIKSTNILLGDRLVAKIADFGLSKLMGDVGKGHVSTQIKGTVGYLDPDYYMTQQLTDKSDVYSFGVLMLELITARKPVELGRYIVREVQSSMDKTKELYNLQGIVDPEIGSTGILHGFERFVDLAFRCVENERADRPPMREVVKEIETILQDIDSNKNENSAFTCTSYEESNPLSEESFN